MLTAGDTGAENRFSILAVCAAKALTMEALASLQMEAGGNLGRQDGRYEARVDGRKSASQVCAWNTDSAHHWNKDGHDVSSFLRGLRGEMPLEMAESDYLLCEVAVNQ
jgi:hypothetical protein